MLGIFGRDTDPNLEALLNPEKPRSEKGFRASAEQEARDELVLFSRQREALDRWADICWKARIDPNRTLTIEAIADSEGMPRRRPGVEKGIRW